MIPSPRQIRDTTLLSTSTIRLIINLLEFSTISNFTNDDTHLVGLSVHRKNLSYTDCQS